MKSRLNYAVVTLIARRGLVLVGLLVATHLASGLVRAQSNVAVSAPEAKAQPEQSIAKVAPSTTVAASKAAAAPVEKSPANGEREGIKVHGHWTIEVRNPDGTVDKHVEFENQICPDQTYTRPGTLLTEPASGTFVGGAAFFAQVASGSSVPGAWQIVLGSAADANAAPIPSGCVTPLDVWTPFDHAGFAPSDLINIIQSNDSAASNCVNSEIAGANTENCSLTLAPPPIGPNIALSGTYLVSATSSGNIDVVSTVNNWCGSLFDTPALCLSGGSGGQLPAIVTGTQLPGGAVYYSGGQTIAVTVQISFQ